MNDNNLQHIWDAVAAPLDPRQIKSKPSFYKDKATGERKQGKEIRFIDKTAVEERLNSVCPGDWHFQVTPIVTPAGSDGQWVVKGTLTICGVVREDFGVNDNESDYDPPKAAVSDALKRCAALFGFGRELVPGHSAQAPEIKTGGSAPTGKPKPASAPQKPAQAATEPSGVDQTTGEIASDLLPPVDKAMADMDGRELYQIQHNAYTALNMNHENHFENRWKKRYAVKNLRHIPGTFGDFMTVMAMEETEQEKVA